MVVIREARVEEGKGICAFLNSAFEPFRSQYTDFFSMPLYEYAKPLIPR
jgi:hypothetical protein